MLTLFSPTVALARSRACQTLDPLKPGETLDSDSEIEVDTNAADESGSDDEAAAEAEDEPWGGIRDDAEAAAPAADASDNDESAGAEGDDAEPATTDAAEEPVVLTAKEKKARERKAKLALEKAERKRKLAEEDGPAAKLPALEPLPDSFDGEWLPRVRSTLRVP